MVERSLSMREVPGSIPGFSNSIFVSFNGTLLSFFLQGKTVGKTLATSTFAVKHVYGFLVKSLKINKLNAWTQHVN